MATALTTLTRIKLVAKDDAGIQALSASDPEVIMVLEDVALWVIEAKFGTYTELAQRYAAAHFLSIANQPVGGRGPLSSESVGGVSQTFTLPYLNQKTVLGSTQFGLMYMECVRRNIVPIDVIVPL